jgi:hypothetical protein
MNRVSLQIIKHLPPELQNVTSVYNNLSVVNCRHCSCIQNCCVFINNQDHHISHSVDCIPYPLKRSHVTTSRWAARMCTVPLCPSLRQLVNGTQPLISIFQYKHRINRIRARWAVNNSSLHYNIKVVKFGRRTNQPTVTRGGVLSEGQTTSLAVKSFLRTKRIAGFGKQCLINYNWGCA